MWPSLHHNYVSMCEEYQTEAEERVVNALKRACLGNPQGTGLSLNLDEVALTTKTCLILGELLSSIMSVDFLSFADCAIDDCGIQSLLQGLRKGGCKQLNLQGNNIRGGAAEKLGVFLRENNNIECLLLEWNSLGINEKAFGVFCEGLGSNQSLRFLDLRNNQISHEGIRELSQALTRNKSLRKLDLRWNNAGIIGGRHLLAAFEANETLAKLKLVGNNVPNETLEAIALAASHNFQRCQLTEEYLNRERKMAGTIHTVKKESAMKIGDLIDDLEATEKKNHHETRKASSKIQFLQDTLDERKATLHSTVLKLSMAQSESVIAQQRIEDLESTIAELTSNYHQLNEDYNRERKKNAVVGDLERKYHQQKQEITTLENQLLDMKVAMQLKESKTIEQLKAKDQEMNHELQKADAIRQKQLSQLRVEHVESESVLKASVQQSQQALVNLQVEMSALNKSVVLEKTKMSEDLKNYKSTLVSEQDERVRLLEDQIKSIQSNKDQLQSQSRELLSSQTELKAANAALRKSEQRLQEKINALHKELASKDEEKMILENRLQEQLKQRGNELDDERRATNEVRLQLKTSSKNLTDTEYRHQQALERKEREVLDLIQKKSLVEGQLQGILQESAQRATALQSAITSYVRPFAVSSSP